MLLVEDDPHDLRMYGTTLWYNGFDVVTAADGEAAVALAAEYSPDMVLLDLLLPKLTGLEVCQRIRESGSSVPVVALTGRARQEFGHKARQVGCTDYLEKPVRPLDVLHLVEESIGRPPPAGDEPSGDSSRTWPPARHD